MFNLHIYPYGAHGLATADKLTLDPSAFDTVEKHKKLADVHDWLKKLKKWFDLIL